MLLLLNELNGDSTVGGNIYSQGGHIVSSNTSLILECPSNLSTHIRADNGPISTYTELAIFSSNQTTFNTPVSSVTLSNSSNMQIGGLLSSVTHSNSSNMYVGSNLLVSGGIVGGQVTCQNIYGNQCYVSCLSNSGPIQASGVAIVGSNLSLSNSSGAAVLNSVGSAVGCAANLNVGGNILLSGTHIISSNAIVLDYASNSGVYFRADAANGNPNAFSDVMQVYSSGISTGCNITCAGTLTCYGPTNLTAVSAQAFSCGNSGVYVGAPFNLNGYPINGADLSVNGLQCSNSGLVADTNLNMSWCNINMVNQLQFKCCPSPSNPSATTVMTIIPTETSNVGPFTLAFNWCVYYPGGTPYDSHRFTSAGVSSQLSGNTTWSSFSDERLKTSIEPLWMAYR